MAKASIHFSAVKSNSERHNLRETKLDYNYPDLEVNNESWMEHSIQDRTDSIQDLCKEVSGRKMQRNATPVREAVINLNPEHTMTDLQQLANTLKAEKGIECFQIHIHRDEGKSRDELNHHAHMVFDWQNKETGKMLRLNKADLSQIQTIVSNSLKMERGILKENSNRERLEAVEFKRGEQEKELSLLRQQVELLEQKKNRASQANNQARKKYTAAAKRYKDRRDRIKGLVADFLRTGDTEHLETAKACQIASKWLEKVNQRQQSKIRAGEDRNKELRSAIQKFCQTSQFGEYEKLRDQVRRVTSEIEVGQRNIKHLEGAIARTRNRKKP